MPMDAMTVERLQRVALEALDEDGDGGQAEVPYTLAATGRCTPTGCSCAWIRMP
jgi:hypothetical protein